MISMKERKKFNEREKNMQQKIDLLFNMYADMKKQNENLLKEYNKLRENINQ